MSKATARPQPRQFALIGLGVMGQNIALNVLDKGFPIAVWNRSADGRKEFARLAEDRDVLVAESLPEMVRALTRPRQILLMISAGKPVDSVIADLVPLLEPGDVILDGGNSLFEDTARRERELEKRGLRYFGVGISGGEEGARHGPSLMPGGDAQAWKAMAPLFEAISAKTEAGPCVTHVGPGGAGHYVKMVHNGIEYADMQLIAEAYDLLKRACKLSAAAQADVFESWNKGPLQSFLIEITIPILRKQDSDGSPLVERVLDRAGQKGTGRWTVATALDQGVAIPSIAASVDARILSAAKSSRQKAEKLLGHLDLEPQAPSVADLEGALLLAKICAYAQGFDMIRNGSERFEWKIDLAEIARIWKGGCIIRARLLDEIRSAYAANANQDHLLLAGGFRQLVAKHHRALRAVVVAAAHSGIPVPVFSASLAYLDSLRTGRLPQNLTQAQRDAFGAHTYARTDDPTEKAVHSEWL